MEKPRLMKHDVLKQPTNQPWSRSVESVFTCISGWRHRVDARRLAQVAITGWPATRAMSRVPPANNDRITEKPLKQMPAIVSNQTGTEILM